MKSIKISLEHRSTRDLIINQIKLQEEIQRRAKINIVECGSCGSTFLHKIKNLSIKNHEITCPYCKFTSDPCGSPDLFYSGMENNSEFN